MAAELHQALVAAGIEHYAVSAMRSVRWWECSWRWIIPRRNCADQR